jgi:hypothetical protein
MVQEAASLDLVGTIFKLSPRELQVLRSCKKGDALLLTNEKRVQVRFEASQAEHALATTDPRELLALAGDVSNQPTVELQAMPKVQVTTLPSNGHSTNGLLKGGWERYGLS